MLSIKGVIYLQDEGGIGCDLGMIGDEKEVLMCSLTHLSLRTRKTIDSEMAQV